MQEINKPILVIGGGISGITATVELAEVGKEVILVEKQPYLGGNVIKMNNYFPKLCPPACGLEINFKRIRQNPRIKIFTSSEVQQIEGEKGNFSVQVKTRPQYVKDTCTACGKCVNVCPEERPNDFNYNFDKTKAVYIPHEMAFPFKYSIDDKYCKKEACHKCVDICEYNAIDFSAEETIHHIKVHSVITATGWKNYNAENIENMHYADYKNVVTNVEVERLIANNGFSGNKFVRPSDNNEPKKIIFIQCAGSRDKNNLSYCSAVCCTASLKHALTIQEKLPDSKIKIFYIDLRVSGRNEDFLNRVKENKNIELIKGKAANIEENNATGNLIVEAENILLGKKQKHEADLVVLATGIVPNNPGFSMVKNNFGFLTTKKNEGIHVVACSRKPMNVSTSVKDATGAALKALQ